ncbi:MAG: hypothetical protein H6835_06260 [Planctomycetes bacterium]|nr:hypothetical protein [Planctomycetota bacterium]
MSRSLLLAAVLPTLAGPAWSQVALSAVPELARARAERLRPQQVAALEPFWADLSLDYDGSKPFLDERIAKAAELGDSVVPLLLEKLQPAQGGSTARHLADNCARVLARLDPGSFVDALAEMARGKHDIARNEAIMLLGYANVPLAGRVLTDLVDKVTGDDLRHVLTSLRRLRYASAAPKVVALLGSSDRRVREEVLEFLIAAKASSVAPSVVQALGAETDNRLLPTYVQYFAAAVRRDANATAALLPLLGGERLDWNDTKDLVAALADVAPVGHDETCRKLHELVDANDSSSLGVAAAVSLRKLGDKQGAVRLRRALDEKLRRRKREAALYEQRASLLFEIGEYADAIDDYEKILEFTEGIAMTRRAYEGLIRSEARRHKIQNLVKQLKASGMTVREIEQLGEGDEAVQTALGHDRVRSFLRQLAKEQAPK